MSGLGGGSFLNPQQFPTSVKSRWWWFDHTLAGLIPRYIKLNQNQEDFIIDDRSDR